MREKTKKKSAKANSKRTLTILICIFVAAVLCFGAVFGIIALVREHNAVVKFNGITMTEGVASYLAATFKSDFMKEHRITADTERTWQSSNESGITYGELLKNYVDTHVKRVIIGSYLFDTYFSLSKAEKNAIEKATRDRLLDEAGGDKDRFNEIAAPMGFEYSDFVTATKMMYKADRALSAEYGENTFALSSSDFLRYFETYSHVKLLFIRTESEFVLDEEGNRVIGEDGNDKTEPLDEKARNDRLNDIAEIDAAIEALAQGGDGRMSPETFDVFLKKYSYNYDFDVSGYYLSENSDYYREFAAMYPKIMKASLDAEIGDYIKVEYGDGVCYIYKYNNDYKALSVGSNTAFFSDFYIDAAVYIYSGLVEFKKGYTEIDPLSIPYNTWLRTYVEI